MASPLTTTDLKPRHARPAERAAQAAIVPAVITGGDLAALGMARSLGAAGVPVIVLHDDADAPCMHSRYVRPVVVNTVSGPALIDHLLELRSRLDQTPLLFLRYDTQVRIVSQYRARLRDAYQIRLPVHRCIRALLHKQGFQRLAESYGFPVPTAVSIRGEHDFGKLAAMEFPAIVKPCETRFLQSCGAPRAQVVSSAEDAKEVCRATLAKAPELVVQQWIDGGDGDIYFCLQYRGEGGVTVRSFTGRKLRSWPPQMGSTASCMPAPEYEAELQTLTTAFFDKTRFVGLGSMEFKRDRRRGKFFMIEPTVGRTDWQEEVATLNGVDIPLAAYCYELGLAQPRSKTPRRPVIWSNAPQSWRWLFASRSLRDSRPSGSTEMGACWRVSDPVPCAFFCHEWLRRILNRIGRSLRIAGRAR